MTNVIDVNIYTGFTDNYLSYDVHYNELGAEFIADRYYEVLVEVLE